MNPSIVTIKGQKPGKTIAVFAGIHGDELAGVEAVTSASEIVEITSGIVHFVIANPQAVKDKVRFTEKNLNRCFVKNNTGQTYEDGLARQLMALLDKSDALLDLHGYNGPEDRPFLICEAESFDLASKLDFGVVSSGWSATEPGGTDGYMHAQSKIAICAECGSNFRADQYADLATGTINQYLRFFGAINQPLESKSRPQQFIKVVDVVKKQTDTLVFSRPFSNFDLLEPGEIFATDGDKKYQAGKNQVIIFPRPKAKIGDEAFVLGEVGL